MLERCVGADFALQPVAELVHGHIQLKSHSNQTQPRLSVVRWSDSLGLFTYVSVRSFSPFVSYHIKQRLWMGSGNP
jgi:hypothetical protein